VLGQPVIVENKSGAGAIVATQGLLRAPADGYTLMMASNNLVIGKWVYKHLPFDSLRDLRAIRGALLGTEKRPAFKLSKLFDEYEAATKDEVKDLSPNQLRVWRNGRKRAVVNFVEIVGDKPVNELTPDDDEHARLILGLYLATRRVCVLPFVPCGADRDRNRSPARGCRN
jgi:hypothetical protein